MAENLRLASVLQTRSIEHYVPSDSMATATLDNGDTLTIRTGPPDMSGAVIGKIIAGARQSGCRLDVDFNDGSSWKIVAAAAQNSVEVRSADGLVKYSG